MQVFREIEAFISGPKPVVTIGTFDGLHEGHRSIFHRMRQIADRIGGETVVVTFEPHPRLVLSGGTDRPYLLHSPAEKLEAIEAAGMAKVLVIPFNRDFSLLNSNEFIESVLLKTIRAHTIVIGYDHRFGHNREGGLEALRRFTDIQVEEIPAFAIDHITVSSTKIRSALQEGDIESASNLLGQPYQISGTVVKGRQLGRTIGFPTANLLPDHPDKLIPENGVYVVEVEVDQVKYPAVMNIGNRPTVEGQHRTIEAHLLDVDMDVYGKAIRIFLHRRLREERKFPDLDSLKAQIQRDSAAAAAFFTHTPHL